MAKCYYPISETNYVNVLHMLVPRLAFFQNADLLMRSYCRGYFSVLSVSFSLVFIWGISIFSSPPLPISLLPLLEQLFLSHTLCLSSASFGTALSLSFSLSFSLFIIYLSLVKLITYEDWKNNIKIFWYFQHTWNMIKGKAQCQSVSLRSIPFSGFVS